MKKYILLFVICVLLIFSLNSNAYYEFEGVGEAIIENNNTTLAKDLAEKKALKNGLETTLGMSIHSKTNVDIKGFVDENIQTKTKGYIKEYEIINIDYNLNSVEVKVKGKVKKEISEDKEFKNIIKSTNNPRVMVVTNHDRGHYLINQNNLARIIKTQVEKTLLDKGFYLINQQSLENSKEKRLKKALANNNLNLASNIALEEGIELLILIEGNVSRVNLPNDFGGMQLINAHSTLSVNAINVDNSQIIESFNSKENEVALNTSTASEKAVKKNSENVGEKISEKMLDFSSNKINQYKLLISNISYNNYIKLEKELKNIQEIKEIYFRNFSNNLLKLEIDSNNLISLNQLLEILINNCQFDFKIESIGQTNAILILK